VTALNRRSFLKGALSVVAATVVLAKLPKDFALPQIIGDGLHDDTAGLQAALNGEPFLCDGCVVRNATEVVLHDGTYRLTSMITMPPFTTLRGEGAATVQAQHAGTVINMTDHCTLDNFYVQGDPVPMGPIVEYTGKLEAEEK
jgi:hypothetical protein